MVHIFDLFFIVLSGPEVFVVVPHGVFLLELSHLIVHSLLMLVLVLLEVIAQIVHGLEVVPVESDRLRLRDLEWLSFGIVAEAICHVEIILIYLSS